MAGVTMILVASTVLVEDFQGFMGALVATQDYTGVLVDITGDSEGSTGLSLPALVVQRLKNQTAKSTRKPKVIKNLPQKVRRRIESIR